MSDGPGWLGVALGTAAGLLAGILLVVVIGGARDRSTRTVTAAAPRATGASPGGRVITTTAVPDVLGTRLDVAKQRVRRAGFDVSVSGGGVLGVVDDTNWQVVAQDPPGGNTLERGSTITVDIERGSSPSSRGCGSPLPTRSRWAPRSAEVRRALREQAAGRVSAGRGGETSSGTCAARDMTSGGLPSTPRRRGSSSIRRWRSGWRGASTSDGHLERALVGRGSVSWIYTNL